MTYKQKIEEALEHAKTLEDFDYIQGKLEITDQINRRTLAGRKLTEELLDLIQSKRNEAIIKYNLKPF